MSKKNGGGMSTGILALLVGIAALLCIILGVLMYMDKHGMLGGGSATEASEEAGNAEARPVGADDGTGQAQVGADAAEDAESEDYAESAYDLLPEGRESGEKELASTDNPDVYAWLYIPESGIDDPVLQSSEDAFYYSTHNSEGAEDPKGALYTQSINSKDFSDNMTVIYGSNTGAFSRLSVFSDPDFFDSHPLFYIYTEDKVYIYETFAAYESDDRHIIMFYGTDNDDQYSVYLSMIEDNMGIGGLIDTDCLPGPDEKTLTLSTGVNGRDDRRFLVQARLYEVTDAR
ncbi:MAG: class B sortase [Lachnospiraceae bacterium]|nr:class B sortase [Lachnospiraceae bacterium]